MLFKPYYGTCKGNWKQQGCGNRGWITTNSRRLCQVCEKQRKPPKPITKRTEKKKNEIKESNKYYRWAIARNILKNKGKCRCDECGDEIKNPVGRNVCHIIAFGANKALYLEAENHFILGKAKTVDECNCGDEYDNGTHRKEMKIYAQSEEIKIMLKAKYYTGSN